MWLIFESDEDVQVLPEGEETFHSWDNECNCCPKISFNALGKLVVSHNAFDQRQVFDIAYNTPLHRVRQEVDC